MAEKWLPEHIIYQIFLRMPTKYVIQLKCLSKQWNRLISDPFFVKSRSRRMVFINSLPFQAIDINGDPSLIRLRKPFGNLKIVDFTIVASFNGIVFLVIISQENNWMIFSGVNNMYRCHMILYNPLSRESKIVPDPLPVNDKRENFVYGFGFGTTINDLKIVRIKSLNMSSTSSCEVFNLRNWSWSTLSFSIGVYDIFNVQGTFANGFLYWYAVLRDTDYPRCIIVALDLKKMVFSNIQIPGGHQCIHLGTYNGQLCMISNRNDKRRSELWVMDENGSGKLWSIVCSFKGVSIFDVLCILDDGRLVMHTSNHLVICDMLKDSHKELDVLKSFVEPRRSQASEYVESLISPSNICSISSPPHPQARSVLSRFLPYLPLKWVTYCLRMVLSGLLINEETPSSIFSSNLNDHLED